MSACRVVVADPLPLFRSSVRALLAREWDFVLCEAADTAELLELAERERPDVALVDLELPPGGGIEAVRRLTEAVPCRAVVWGFSPPHESVLEAVHAGAHGFLHKEMSPAGLVRAIRAAAGGEAPLTRALTTKIVDALHEVEQRRRTRGITASLSAREREVLELLARGARNKQIAAALAISEFTVKRHVQNILHKLGVSSRREAGWLYADSLQREVLLPVGSAA